MTHWDDDVPTVVDEHTGVPRRIGNWPPDSEAIRRAFEWMHNLPQPHLRVANAQIEVHGSRGECLFGYADGEWKCDRDHRHCVEKVTVRTSHGKEWRP